MKHTTMNTKIKTRRDLIAALEASPTVSMEERGDSRLFVNRPKRGRISKLWIWADGTMMDAQVDLGVAKCLTIADAARKMGVSN